jgi:hypothetical protein
MRAAREFRIEDQVIQFLTGLNDTFSVVKTQVLLMDPLPSINKVYSMVVQEESNNTALTSASNSTEDSSILVNASDARRTNARGKSSSGFPQSKNNSRYCKQVLTSCLVSLLSLLCNNFFTNFFVYFKMCIL